MVNYEFPPIGAGGGTTTRFLAKYLVKLGVKVHVYTARPIKEYTVDHPDGFRLHYVGPIKKKLTTTHIPELARFALTVIYYSKPIIEEVKPDLIHCFFAIPSGCFGLYCKKIYKIPYITSILGADVPGFDIGDWRLHVYHGITQFITRSIWENSEHIVANSPSLKGVAERFCPHKKIEVITNGVDSEVFYPLLTKAPNQKEVQLLYLSRLTLQKGIWTLIKALGILKQRNVLNFKLTVVGEGHLKDEMFSLINKFGLQERVDFIGWKKLEELPDIYRISDIFILPSVMEGMSSVILQAMACGLPIITSRVKGNTELVEDNYNGLMAEYNNAEEFADAIEKLIKVPELRVKMGRNSFEKSKKFLWENIAKQYLELYEKTLYKKIKTPDKILV